MYISRMLTMNLPLHQSAFLWGPRKVGKSTYLKKRYPDSIYYDFLQTDIARELYNSPSLIREWLSAESPLQLKKPIIIDEVQKVPLILDELHWLIENKGLSFILCGSSTRKLKHGAANLLGGRAWRYQMFPLTTPELGEVDLLTVLNRGSIPSHYASVHAQRFLHAYLEDYLKQEVFAEGLTRNMPAFSRFFQVVGLTHGEMVNYSNIARDVGIDAKTVREYYQILVDTLLGDFILPYTRNPSRDIIKLMPKFYLFDVGVAGAISKRKLTSLEGFEFGKAFEHYIYTELIAYKSYKEKDFRISYWRTKTGLEVDFILGDAPIAIEIKASKSIHPTQLKGLRAFKKDYNPDQLIIVSQEARKRKLSNGIIIYPWRDFLNDLWAGKII